MSFYHQVGESLRSFICDHDPTTQQTQAWFRDVLQDDELMPAMLDVVARPSFRALHALTRSNKGQGIAQRDTLLQELGRTYLPEVVDQINAVLTGILGDNQPSTLPVTAISKRNQVRPKREDQSKTTDHFAKGYELYDQGLFLFAAHEFEQHLISNQDPLTYFRLGNCYEALRDHQKALEAFQHIIHLKPSPREYDYIYIGMQMHYLGSHEEAIEQFTQEICHHRDSEDIGIAFLFRAYAQACLTEPAWKSIYRDIELAAYCGEQIVTFGGETQPIKDWLEEYKHLVADSLANPKKVLGELVTTPPEDENNGYAAVVYQSDIELAAYYDKQNVTFGRETQPIKDWHEEYKHIVADSQENPKEVLGEPVTTPPEDENNGYLAVCYGLLCTWIARSIIIPTAWDGWAIARTTILAVLFAGSLVVTYSYYGLAGKSTRYGLNGIIVLAAIIVFQTLQEEASSLKLLTLITKVVMYCLLFATPILHSWYLLELKESRR